MLLQRALSTLQDCADRPALFLPDRVFRFGDLGDALLALPRATSPIIAHGPPLDVVLATLHAWRDQQPLLPAADGRSPYHLHPSATADAAHLAPTTDDPPRLIRFSADQLAAEADRLVTALDLQPATPQLAAFALSSSVGFSSLVLPLLLHGIPLTVPATLHPDTVAATARKHDRLVLSAEPATWAAWHQADILRHLPHTLAITTGTPLPLDLEIAVFEHHRLKLHHLHRAPECGGISFDTTTIPRSHAADLGHPLPGIEVSIGRNQRFLVASSSVALGYDQPQPGDLLGNGRFLTADHGCLVAGHLHLDSAPTG